MTSIPIEHVNDVFIVIHPIFNKKGEWTENVYLSIVHSPQHTMKQKEMDKMHELAALACSAIYTIPKDPWLKEYLEEEIYRMEKDLGSYTVDGNVIKLDFSTETEGEA